MSRAKQFHVGDVVRVIWAKPGCEHFVGRTCRVTSEAFPHPYEPGRMMHHLDLEPDPGYTGCMAAAEHLELVYDGNRRVSWDQCAWRPLDVNLPAFLRPQAS